MMRGGKEVGKKKPAAEEVKLDPPPIFYSMKQHAVHVYTLCTQ